MRGGDGTSGLERARTPLPVEGAAPTPTFSPFGVVPPTPQPVVTPLAAPIPGPVPAPRVSDAPTQGSGFDLFEDLVADVASAIASSVPPWRVRIGEATARWQAAGVATTVLERALRLQQAPDVDGLLAAFEQAVARLRALEIEARRLDATLGGHAMFRDPARVAEAQAAVDALLRGRAERAGRPPFRVDPESWVREWPDVVGLLVDAA